MWARAYSAGNSKVQSDHPRKFSGKSILKTFNSWNIRAFYEVTPDGSNEFKCLHINHPDPLKASQFGLQNGSAYKFNRGFLE
jgi:hypothetical protein